ncbi:MAG: alpha-amylase family glycosyl hydrolase [Myxococcota bacterium]|nr:alpha-amylase family glycosyl hydrolase [Myxococcota bacterium]
MSDRLWWQHGVIYQIYPRSFMDANGDGVGDLEGIRQRLDHLAWLGVDAIWLSPCFPSPMADFGYDVADYCDIDPLFGTLADFDRLLADAHARDIRVVLDWVPNHTSDQHAWFRESRASRESPKRDWYVWRDPRPDGSPPNNWAAIFGGPAWEWDEATGQYYLHMFLREQPDLNWRHPEVEAAMHEVLRFWLDRGVDGFRIDVIHHIAKDPALRDNPVIAGGLPGWGGLEHVHDQDHPDIHPMLRRLRGVLDAYPERMAVGEVYIMDPAVVARYYGRGDELHLAFNFSFLHTPWDAERMRDEFERFDGLVPAEGWPDSVLSNHDVPRHATRYDHPQLGDRRARVAAALLLTLRGTPFLYYGEEIGMRNVEVPVERMQDPLAVTLHPKVSRDGERTPMLWTAAPGAGFSSADPWLPLGAPEPGADVDAQRADPRSLLSLYRDLIGLRRATPALHRGSYRRLDAPAGVWAFERRAGDERVRVALNFGDTAVAVDLGEGHVQGGLRTGDRPLPATPRVELEPCEAAVLVLGGA